MLPDYRWQLAACKNNLATMLMLVEPVKAREAYDEALSLYEQLVEKHPRIPEYRNELGRTRGNLSLLLERIGKRDEAEKLMRRAVAVREQLAADFPKVLRFRYDLARSYVRHGDLLRTLGRGKEAHRAVDKGRELHKQLAADSSSIKDTRYERAMHQLRRASQLAHTGPFDEGERAIRQGQALLVELTAEFPTVQQYRVEVALATHMLSVVCEKRGRHRDAEEACGKSLRVREQLAADLPDRREYQQEIANSLSWLGVLLLGSDKFEEAEKALKRAIAILEPLTVKDSNWTQARKGLASYYNNLGLVFWKQDRLGDAMKVHQRALDLRRKLAAQLPDAPEIQAELAVSHGGLGGVLQELGKLDQAEEHLVQALSIFRRLKGHTQLPGYRDHLGVALSRLGNLLEAKTKPKEAVRQYSEAAEIFEALASDFPDVPAYRLKAAAMHCNGAAILAKAGSCAEAKAAYHKANALDINLAAVYFDHGTALLEKGKLTEAEAAYRTAIALKPDYAAAYNNLGKVLRDQGKVAGAEDAWRKGFANQPELADKVESANRYDACAAALAGCGQGKDAAKLDDKEKRRLRDQALAWLRAELQFFDKQYQAGHLPGVVVLSQRLAHAQYDPDFKRVRDSLAALPDPEQAAWRKLWSDTDQLLKQARAGLSQTTFQGTLTDKTRRQFHNQQLEAGKTYVIDMHSSAFDTYLKLLDGKGNLVAENDDIAPNNLNSRVIFTPKEAGTFRIMATSFQERGRGAYTVTITTLARKAK